jgi:hypothetical protein
MHAEACACEKNEKRDINDLSYVLKNSVYSKTVYGQIITKALARVDEDDVGRYMISIGKLYQYIYE